MLSQINITDFINIYKNEKKKKKKKHFLCEVSAM